MCMCTYTHIHMHKYLHMYIFTIGYLSFLVNKMHFYITGPFFTIGPAFCY